ncbi:MAG: hypothetical protein HKM92_05120, partial [Arenibacter sp.]|nr:hypothetical protein [Arenibacter sp.]
MNKSFSMTLSDNWKIQSSNEVTDQGEHLSTDASLSTNWIPAMVPSTVLGTLVHNNTYNNPYFGENLKEIPTQLFN